MKISVNQKPYYAVKSYHISPDLHTNRDRVSAQSFSALGLEVSVYFQRWASPPEAQVQ